MTRLAKFAVALAVIGVTVGSATASWASFRSVGSGAGAAKVGTFTKASGGLRFTICTSTNTTALSCPTSGSASVGFQKNNNGGPSTWTARVSLVDGSGNIVTNTGSTAISVSIARTLGSGSFTTGTTLSILPGASESATSFTFTNAGTGNGSGSATVTASSTGRTDAVASISW